MRQIVGSGNKNGRYLVVLGKPGKFDSERGRRSVFSNVRSYEVISQTLLRAGVDPKDCYFVPAVSRYKENWKPAEIIADAEQYILPLLNVKNRRAIAFGGTAAVALGLIKSLDGVSSLYGQACRTSLGGVSKWATVTNDPFFLFKEPEEINKAFLHVYYGIQRIQKLKGSNSDLLEFPKFEVCMLDSVEDIEEMMHCYSAAISGDDFFEKHMAYDHETTQLDAKKALIATTAFCNGQWTDEKGFKSWLWAPYDSLVPRFSASKEKKLEKKLMEFYRMLHRQQTEFEGEEGGRVAHNRIYDDWVTHTNYQDFLGHKPMFSLWDTKIMSWQMDSLSRNGLKEMYERLFGVPNYDEKIEAAVREVTARRQASKALVDPADFRTLKVLGHAPRVVTKKNGDETLKWPKELGAKEGAYAAVPLDVLGPYNCMDAVATWQMFTHQHAWLAEQGMLDVCKWKHHVSIRLHEATMHGLPTDKKMNRKWSAQLTELEAQCADIVRNSLEELGVPEEEIEKFKAGSPDHVRAILFGKPAEVPALDTAKHEEALMELFGGMKKAKSVVSFSLNALWSSPSFKKAAQAGSLDKKEVSQAAKELIHSEFGISDPKFTTSKHYFGGLLQPKEDAFTKTGLPSVSKVVLERHLEEDAEEGDKARKFIKSILMLSRIRKIRGTFVDGIYKQLDGVWCHPYYNEIGTKSGRASSSNPNGQNYIKKIRGQHLALKGHTFFEFDFSQAEIRVAAAMSQDPKLMEVVASGADLHTLTAMFLFNVSEAEVEANDNYRKAAKAQPNYADIPTPFGSKKMGELVVGDYVVGSKGKPTKVIGVHPQGLKQVYEVVFSNGQIVECADEHLWTVKERVKGEWNVRTLNCLAMLQEGCLKNTKHKQRKFFVDLGDPVEYAPSPVPLPIGPYTVGVLLGDGNIQTSAFTSNDPEVGAKVSEELKDYGWELVDATYGRRTKVYRINSTRKPRRSIASEFRRFDPEGKFWVSYNKRIPKPYMTASIKDRWELLRGLMDTDGTCSLPRTEGRPGSNGQAIYCSVSPGLAYDVAQLARSLGGKAKIRKSEVRNGRDYYRVEVWCSECPFALPRKAERWRATSLGRRLAIDTVRPTERYTEMTCISVDAEDHLYQTAEFIPTHNTLNFGIIYGLSAFRLAKTLKISVDEAEELIMERYFGLYKRLAEWMQEEKLLASKPPYFVTTPAGTRISTLNTLSYNPEIRSHAERLAVNAQVQGGAGELAFHVIDRLCERIEANGWLNEEGTNGFCNTVHDSAAFMIWNKLKLAWYESGTDGQPGRVVGPLVEELQAIVEAPAPWSPLDTVPFKVDIELNTRWAGMPDLMSAIDPNFKKLDKRAVEWDLIDIEKLDRIHLTAEEKREIEEIKELEGEVVLY